MTVYSDSMIFMYFLDALSLFHLRASGRLSAMNAAGDVIAFSDVTRLECRVKPIMLGDAQGLADMDALFSRPDLVYVPITTAVFDRATTIRARNGFQLGDSLYLAAAIEGGCDSFLTNDKKLAAFTDIPVEIPP